MIKKVCFIMFCCISLLQTSIRACDVCGSSTSGIGIGLLADYRSNFVRLNYINTRFKSYPEHDYLVSDKFQQLDLLLRFTVKKRMKLMANVPFRINSRDSESEHKTLRKTGLSDIRLLAAYVLLNNIEVGKKTKLYLEAGGGFSLPTGKYDEQIHEKNLPENFNIGKGSLGYIYQMNTVLSIGKFGIVQSNSYQHNGKTKPGYKFGNQFTAQLTTFREMELPKFRLIPNLGLGFENTSQDHYANANKVSGTGGNGIYLSAAINFKTDSWLAGITYSNPLMENYSGGEVSAKGKISCQISFIF